MNNKTFKSLLMMGIITTSGLILTITESQAQIQNTFQYQQTELIGNGKSKEVINDNLKPYKNHPDHDIIALENNNKDAERYFIICVMYFDSKEYKNALDNCTKAIEIQSDYEEAYFLRGSIYGQLDEYEKALADFNRAIEIKSDYPEAYLLRGTIYALLKEYQKGNYDAQKAAQLFNEKKDSIGYQKAQELLKLIAQVQKTNP